MLSNAQSSIFRRPDVSIPTKKPSHPKGHASELHDKFEMHEQLSTHHADDILAQVCIDDARRRWRWYSAVVQDAVVKHPEDKGWIVFLLGLLNETRKTLDRAVANTAAFHTRTGIPHGAFCCFTSHEFFNGRSTVSDSYPVPCHDGQGDAFQKCLPYRTKANMTNLETRAQEYLWDEFSMDSLVNGRRGMVNSKSGIGKLKRVAASKRKAFERMLEKARAHRLKQFETFSIRMVETTAASSQPFQLAFCEVRPKEHPDDVVAQRAIDDTRRRWLWYEDLLKEALTHDPHDMKLVGYYSQVADAIKKEHDAAVAETKEFNTQMGITNVSAHEPTVHVLTFWSLRYEERMNALDSLRNSYNTGLALADIFASSCGESRDFQSLMAGANEGKAQFNTALMDARRERLRERAGEMLSCAPVSAT